MNLREYAVTIPSPSRSRAMMNVSADDDVRARAEADVQVLRLQRSERPDEWQLYDHLACQLLTLGTYALLGGDDHEARDLYAEAHDVLDDGRQALDRNQVEDAELIDQRFLTLLAAVQHNGSVLFWDRIDGGGLQNIMFSNRMEQITPNRYCAKLVSSLAAIHAAYLDMRVSTSLLAPRD